MICHFTEFQANGDEAPPEKKPRTDGIEACRACLGVLQEGVMQPVLERVRLWIQRIWFNKEKAPLFVDRKEFIVWQPKRVILIGHINALSANHFVGFNYLMFTKLFVSSKDRKISLLSRNYVLNVQTDILNCLWNYQTPTMQCPYFLAFFSFRHFCSFWRNFFEALSRFEAEAANLRPPFCRSSGWKFPDWTSPEKNNKRKDFDVGRRHRLERHRIENVGKKIQVSSITIPGFGTRNKII